MPGSRCPRACYPHCAASATCLMPMELPRRTEGSTYPAPWLAAQQAPSPGHPSGLRLRAAQASEAQQRAGHTGRNPWMVNCGASGYFRGSFILNRLRMSPHPGPAEAFDLRLLEDRSRSAVGTWGQDLQAVWARGCVLFAGSPGGLDVGRGGKPRDCLSAGKEMRERRLIRGPLGSRAGDRL